ncbi:uncharacterized protein LOC102704935 isoform X2 [Oryza brachyantha]|uniref:uncharacterized protein LOC102704935 isoform X2 n=1 Tax=Oryza brachyantha TaxID=4533 RepID=UPI001ADC86D3|nr:uncharacterized protein LOC102704935 isoform X2 [Oryza brachyantha]
MVVFSATIERWFFSRACLWIAHGLSCSFIFILSKGPIYMYSTGSIQTLSVIDPNIVKELANCKSLDVGKSSFLQKERGALLGMGILTSNGDLWVHQRKAIAPELFMDKVKGMVNLMMEAAVPMLNLWKNDVEDRGGSAEIVVDEFLRNFSADVISRACFGSSFSEGKEIFIKIRQLQTTMAKQNMFIGVPGSRYLPTRSNREIWNLDSSIRTLILNIAKKYEHDSPTTANKGLLHAIIQGSKDGPFTSCTREDFIVDNCKNICFAGHETTSTTAAWCLMLLASHHEWQSRTRVELLDVCQGRPLDFDMLRKLKTLTMVIHETLRLYPPAAFVVREALNDIKLGSIDIPKGTNISIPIAMAHRNPSVWGPSADKFDPDRFANGIAGACKPPHMYMPFGVGVRTCAGQNLAIVELKVVLSLLLSKFEFTLSPNYVHCPAFRLTVEPGEERRKLDERRRAAGGGGARGGRGAVAARDGGEAARGGRGQGRARWQRRLTAAARCARRRQWEAVQQQRRGRRRLPAPSRVAAAAGICSWRQECQPHLVRRTPKTKSRAVRAARLRLHQTELRGFNLQVTLGVNTTILPMDQGVDKNVVENSLVSNCDLPVVKKLEKCVCEESSVQAPLENKEDAKSLGIVCDPENNKSGVAKAITSPKHEAIESSISIKVADENPSYGCQTPRESIFDPFAPGAEEVACAPKKKVIRAPELPSRRQLSFDSGDYPVKRLSYEFDDCEEDDQFLERICKMFIDLIISNQALETNGKDLLDSSSPGSCETPSSEPLLTGIADACPDAPMRRSLKVVQLSPSICRKLDFDSVSPRCLLAKENK